MFYTNSIGTNYKTKNKMLGKDRKKTHHSAPELLNSSSEKSRVSSYFVVFSKISLITTVLLLKPEQSNKSCLLRICSLSIWLYIKYSVLRTK